ncbi:YetF domain-containing protein [Clostridium sp. JNZ X4-2]
MKIWIAILLKSTALFFLSLVCIKMLGKKRWAKITPFNFINYIIIAVLIALISVNIIPNWVFGILALAVWVFLPITLDYICMRSKFMYDLINGKEIVVVKKGKVMEENLSKIRYSGEDLLRELRSKNVFNLADVEFAIMESTGDINVILKSEKKPVTPKDLGIQTSQDGAPQTVILDGNVINESLSNLGLNQGWLNEQLELQGVSLDNVFIGQVNSKGELYVDLFDDMIEVPQSNVREMLYASLGKAEADLMSFTLDTQDKNAQDIYKKDSLILKNILEKLKPYLLG